MFSHHMTLTAMPSIRMNHHTLPNSYPVIARPMTVVMKIHRLTRDSYVIVLPWVVRLYVEIIHEL